MRPNARRRTRFAHLTHVGYAVSLAALLAGCGDETPTRPAAIPDRPAMSGVAAQAATNGKIAFATDRHGYPNWEIYVMDADGGAPTRFTNDPAQDVNPAWSPDGAKLAFASDRTPAFDIYYMDAIALAPPTQLTSDAEFEIAPAWSPDGSKVAFGRGGNDGAEIYVINADGTGQIQLTNNTFYDDSPSWSPDGSKIAFTSRRDGNTEIYVMNSDGSAQTRYTDAPADDLEPSWSPDGSKIVFASSRDGNMEIYVMAAAPLAVPSRLTFDAGFDIDPVWSPDGSKIAFRSQRDGNAEIYVMNADGSNQSNLTNDPATDVSPSWQPVPASFTFAFTGFYAPVENPEVRNQVKAGSSVPVKFSLGGDQGLDIFRVDGSGRPYPQFTSEPCETGGVVVPIDETTVSPAGLTYDAATGRYTYVWKTDKAWAGRCGVFQLGLKDGSDHHALFYFVR